MKVRAAVRVSQACDAVVLRTAERFACVGAVGRQLIIGGESFPPAPAAQDRQDKNNQDHDGKKTAWRHPAVPDAVDYLV